MKAKRRQRTSCISHESVTFISQGPASYLQIPDGISFNFRAIVWFQALAHGEFETLHVRVIHVKIKHFITTQIQEKFDKICCEKRPT